MKKYFYTTVLFLFFLSVSQVYSQVIKGAIIGGVNLSQVDGDEVLGFKRVGANVGAAVIVPFTDQWSLTLETIFSMEGSLQKGNMGQWYDSIYTEYGTDSVFLNGAYDLRLNYVRVPVLVHYNDRNLSIGAGIQYGRLVGVKQIEQEIYNTTAIAEEAYNKNDVSILADFKYRIWKGLFFNARYSYSLFSIRERTFHRIYDPENSWNRRQYNNVLTFRIIWVLNDKETSLASQKKESKWY